MKRKLKATPKPTANEMEKLNKYFWMADWHFEKLIADHCREINSTLAGWEKSGKKSDPVYIHIYGLDAIYGEKQIRCLANFFIRFKSSVYQARDIIEASEMVGLLKKEFLYEEYMDKLWDQQFKEREMRKRLKEKGKLRQLPVKVKKAV